MASVTAIEESSARRLRGRWAMLIIIYGATLLGAGLGNHVLTRHEVLAAYPAKEMLRNGHWIVQMFAGIPRTLKPPTMGWLIAACMKIFHSDAEWVVRLPSVIAAIVTALIVSAFAARFYGEMTGVVAGLIQLTCYYVLKQAPLAEADMPLCAAVTAAMVCLGLGTIPRRGTPSADSNAMGPSDDFTLTPARSLEGRGGQRPSPQPSPGVPGEGAHSRRWMLSTGFYLFTGLAFLLKGPNGLIFILAAVVCYALIRREGHILRFLANPVGTIVFAAMLVGWPLAAYLQRPQIVREWWVEMHTTAAGGFGRSSIFSYVVFVPEALLPWAPVTAIGIYLMLKRDGHRRPLVQFLACWFLPGIVYLHFIALKSLHYPIPLLPPFSIAGAVGLLWYIEFQQQSPRAHRLAASIVFVLACVGCAVAVFFVPALKQIAIAGAAALGALCIGGLVAVWFEHRRKMAWQIGALAATAWVVIVIVNLRIVPIFDDYRPLAELARRAVAPIVPAGETIHIIDEEPQVEPHAAYYLRPPILRHVDAPAFEAFAQQQASAGQRELYVLCIKSAENAVSRLWPVQELDRCDKLRRKEPEVHRFVLVKVKPK